MKASMIIVSVVLCLLAGFANAGDIAVRAAKLYTMEGAVLENAVVVIEDGKIRRLGPADRVRIPEGMTVLEAAVVTPGLVDARSTVGLSGIYGGREGQVRDQDQLETSDPLQPELDPLDAYNAHDPLIEWARQYGVTTMHTGHGPGAVISGRTMVVKTLGDTADEALVRPDVSLAITLGSSNSSNFESPGTRAKSVAMLRTALVEAQSYAEKLESKKPPPRSLKNEILLKMLDGDIKAMITAHSITDISAALRLKQEFDLDLMLDGGAEAYRLSDELLAADVPVLLHPPMMRAGGDTRNATFESGRLLQAAGIPFAIQTGYEGYVPKTRVLIFEASIAVANGLGAEDALRAMTLTPAQLLGVAERVGSLKKGKDGDLVLFDGDPFEFTSHVCGVVIEGDLVSDRCW